MSFIIPFGAAVVSSGVRVVERTCLSIDSNAKGYRRGKISFDVATREIVEKIRLYTALTTTKFFSDAIVATSFGRWIADVLVRFRSIFCGLFRCSWSQLVAGFTSSLSYFFNQLLLCPSSWIIPRCGLSAANDNGLWKFRFADFCRVADCLFYLIICKANGFTETIEHELVKYWLEFMGIVRALLTPFDINLVKYMHENLPAIPDEISPADDLRTWNVREVEMEMEKDPDFTKIVTVSLEDLLHGTERPVTFSRRTYTIEKKETLVEDVTYNVTIPAGCAEGTTVRFPSVGHRTVMNQPADLLVQIVTEQHPHFERHGADLCYTAHISLEEAARGFTRQVPTIDGTTELLTTDMFVSTKTPVVWPGKGLPDPNRDGSRGRMLVHIDIELPDARQPVEARDESLLVSSREDFSLLS